MKNQYYHAKIEKIIEHNNDIRSFVFDSLFDSTHSNPGQFAMVWLPGLDEKPFSLSGQNMITLKKVGPFTEKLFEKSKDDHLDIRGPYGNGFPSTVFSTLIGGGCGIAPLFYFVSKLEPLGLSFVLAGKTKKDLIFLEDITKILKNNVYYTENEIVAVTEDGSYGIKGVVTDAKIPKADGNYYVCGPEIMMKKVAEKLIKEGTKSERIFLSLERYMKCGIGICGNCPFSGYRVCTDGPVFRYDKIKDLPHFNKYKRTRTGELTSKL